MKLILLIFLGYSLYKISFFVLSLFKVKSKIKDEATKADFKRKVSKMDIQDAEYEDIWSLRNMSLFVQTIEAKIA